MRRLPDPPERPIDEPEVPDPDERERLERERYDADYARRKDEGGTRFGRELFDLGVLLSKTLRDDA